jgi:hypothetical protein
MKRMRKSRQSKYPWSLWWWTSATENLFDLTPEDLYTFKLLTEQATLKD